MIFVTLGTHPQPMDRLIAEIDRLIESGIIAERVIIQSAAFSRRSRHAEMVGIVGGDRVKQWMREATRVICHGGPASILEALAVGRRPVVVPRDPRAGEHVDDHQQRFVRWVATRRPIIPVWEISALQDALGADPIAAPDFAPGGATIRRLVELVESEGPRRRPRPPAVAEGRVRPVVLVASVRQHIDVFVPVARQLAARGIQTCVLPLDSWYGQGAEAAARRAGLEVQPVRARGVPPAAGFYRRHAWAIWRDVLRAKHALGNAVRGTQIVVLANDSGLLEKVIVHTARRQGVATALIQDGRLTARRPRPSSRFGAIHRFLKQGLSPLLRGLGLPYLGASELGASGVDTIFAAGEAGAAILRARSAGSRVVVSGQPKYDRLAGQMCGGNPDGPVVMFTTPFSAAGLGDRPQASQLRLAQCLAAELEGIGVRIVLKPHPREDPAPYREIRGAAVEGGDAADILVRARAAVVGLSTVVEEAAILGCPVFVPGRVVHEDRFYAHLPDPIAFPRFETAAELAHLVSGLDDEHARELLIARQAEQMGRDVAFDPDTPAAKVIAESLLSLMPARDRLPPPETPGSERFGLLPFMASSGLFQVSRLGVNVVAAALLGPILFGVWNLVVVLQTYTTHATVGLLSGANRRVPLSLGSGLVAEARRTEQAAIGGALAVGLMLAFVATTAGLAAGSGWPIAVAIGLAIGAQQLYLAGQVVLRGNLQFDRAIIQQTLLAVALPAIALPAVSLWGIEGLVLSQAAVYALGLALVLAWRPDVRPALDRGLVMSLIREGAPIMVSGLVFAVATTVDRWAIVAFGSPQELGAYALASTVAAGLLFVNLVVAQQLYPRMAFAFAAGNRDVESIVGLARRQGLVAGGIAVSMAVGIIVLAPAIVPAFLPAYSGSIAALQVLAVAYAALAFASGFTNLLVTIGLASRLIIVHGIAAATGGLLAIFALRMGFGLPGVAFSMLVGFVALGIGTMSLTRGARLAARHAR